MRNVLWRYALSFVLLATTACSTDDADAVSDTLAPAAPPFEWTRAADVETHGAFLRNFGVGYSYDAVHGRFCEWRDIRCQVVDRQQTEDYQNSHEGARLVTTSPLNAVTSQGHFSYSLRDYVANVSMNLHVAIDIGLYNSEKRKRQYFIEDGLQEVYFYTLDEQVQRAECSMAYGELRAMAQQGNERFLTLSFRNAIRHIEAVDRADGNIFASVDSFIRVWGTHVITRSYLGGRLRIDLMSDTYRFNDKSKEEEWTTEEFLWAAQSKDEHRSGTDEFRWVEHGRLNIEAWGGDQSTLTGLLGKHNTDGTRPFSTEGISAWRRSISYDPDDELHSNVEMIDMDVVPIWEFAAAVSPRVAKLIKSAVTQDAVLQQQLLGDRNFFDTAFPIVYPEASCLYRRSTDEWLAVSRTDSDQEPMVVRIVSGGRYVAAVCHEVIDGHTLWVCYPIYEGRLQQACGLGVEPDTHAVYRVRWIGGKCTLTLRTAGAAPTDRFYIYGGEVDVEPIDEVTYAPAAALPAVELSGGIQPDGTYRSTPYHVFKQGQDFILRAPAGLTDIVGYDADGDGLYKRRQDYTYIYNTNELRHE